MHAEVVSVDLELTRFLRESSFRLELLHLFAVPLLVLVRHRFKWSFQLLRERLPLLVDCTLQLVPCDAGILLLQDLLELGHKEIIRDHRLLRLLVLLLLSLRLDLVLRIQ